MLELSSSTGGSVAVASESEAVAWLERNVSRPFRIAGKLEPGNVLAEVLADGRACVLNLTDRDLTELQLETDAARVWFQLPARGVQILPGTSPGEECTPGTELASSDPEFRLALDRPNLMCCRVVASGDDAIHSFTFSCDTALKGQLAARELEKLESVKLDGEQVVFSEGCEVLPEGMREFFTATSLSNSVRARTRWN